MFRYYKFNKQFDIINHTNDLAEFKLYNNSISISTRSGICYMNLIIDYNIYKDFEASVLFKNKIISYNRRLIVLQFLDFVP